MVQPVLRAVLQDVAGEADVNFIGDALWHLLLLLCVLLKNTNLPFTNYGKENKDRG